MVPMTLAKRLRRLNRRSTPPRQWLLTDDLRLPDPLPALRRLPAGSGVILRHYDNATRYELAVAVMREARRRRLVVLVAGDWRLAAALGADGLHVPEGMARRGILGPALAWVRRCGRLLSMACHGRTALGRARRLGADMALLSPVFATASHPGAAAIGAVRFGLWAGRARLPVFALGGMTRRRLARVPLAAGYAAIGAFTGP